MRATVLLLSLCLAQWVTRGSGFVAVTDSPQFLLPGHPTVLVLGDSLAGGTLSNGSVTHNFDGAVFQALEVWIPHVTVVARSIPGAAIADLRMPLKYAIHETSPAVVVLWAGANDLHAASFGGTVVPDTEPIAAALESLVRIATSRRIGVVVLGAPPQREGRPRAKAAPAVVPFNAQVSALLRPNGRAVFVRPDQHIRVSHIGPDGLHLTVDGYEILGRAVAVDVAALIYRMVVVTEGSTHEDRHSSLQRLP